MVSVFTVCPSAFIIVIFKLSIDVEVEIVNTPLLGLG